MAMRAVVPQQQAKDTAAVGDAKQPMKIGGAHPRNRRALGNIGNLVTAKEVQVKPNRPITRNFRAQLLANVQAASLVEKNKKVIRPNVNVPVPVDGVPKRDAATKVAQKKPTVKPKPAEVIEISEESKPETRNAPVPVDGIPKRDAATKVAQKKPAVKPKPAEVIEITEESKLETKKEISDKKNKEKVSRTLTSVLTARSKVACGVTNKSKENIVDIDATDAGNELAAVEYIEDLYKFYKLAEHENRPLDYMESHPEINDRMRAVLVDWLVDVHNKFELSNETLYLTINIVDRFLSTKKAVPKKELQLVGISAMLVASKYEEIWPPQVNDFVLLSAYSHEQILRMEKVILGTLEWTLTVPTSYVFLIRFIKASIPDQKLEDMVHFLSELGIMNYATTMMYCPSMVAASAVFAARCTLNMSPAWTDTLKLHTGYSEEQLMDCARLLVSSHSMAANSKLQVVHRKYSDSQRGAVALLTPAMNLFRGNSPV